MGPPSLNGGNAPQPLVHALHGEASMGPPSLNGGNAPQPLVHALHGEASMGPPSLNGGNRAAAEKAGIDLKLQWGRRLSTAETSSSFFSASS